MEFWCFMNYLSFALWLMGRCAQDSRFGVWAGPTTPSVSVLELPSHSNPQVIPFVTWRW